MNNNMGMSGFSGDMDRNEVEIDLNKFMALLQEKSELKDRIRELEDEKNDNPYQKLIFVAQAVDSWRIIPRAFFKCVHVFIILYHILVHGIRRPYHATIRVNIGSRRGRSSLVWSLYKFI
jgi:hypothetical protein